MLSPKEIKRIQKNCKIEADSIVKEMYELYDAIWWNRIRITNALYDYGKDTVREITILMPNLLTHQPCISPIDEVADKFGFEGADALIQYLLAYSPRSKVRDSIYRSLMEQHLETTDEHSNGADDVPF